MVDDDPEQVQLDVDGQLLCSSTDHGLADVGAGDAERFWGLAERYGHYQLAYLGAVLRLADHQRSQDEHAHPDGRGASS